MSGVKSASRVISILELFEAQRKPLRVIDIVDSLGYPQSSVSALMKTLYDSGYMSFNPQNRSYTPAPQLAFLGHWALGYRESVETIQGVMRRLSDITSMSAMLGARNGIMMQYIHFVVADSEFPMRLRDGTQRPLHRSALGIMLISHMNDADIGRVVRRYYLENPNEPQEPLKDILERVHFASENGYYFSQNLMLKGAGVIGVLMPMTRNSRRFSLGIGGLTDTIKQNADFFVESLKAATDEYAVEMAKLEERGY